MDVGPCSSEAAGETINRQSCLTSLDRHNTGVRWSEGTPLDQVKRQVGDVAERLSGPWFNQLGSRLDLAVDDEGRLSGTFRSSVGVVDDGHAVSGFFATDADGAHGALGFAVSWGAAGSITVWSGHYHESDEVILTTWLLSEAPSWHGDWRSTLVGSDEFRRSESERRSVPWLATSEPHPSAAKSDTRNGGATR